MGVLHQELDMSYNRLELLPQEFGNLMKLQYLNLMSRARNLLLLALHGKGS